jgi:hypothetical protein
LCLDRKDRGPERDRAEAEAVYKAMLAASARRIIVESRAQAPDRQLPHVLTY